MSVLSGYAEIAGSKLFRHPEVIIDKGIQINQLSRPNPKETYRSSNWVTKNVSLVEPELDESIQLDNRWIKRRIRDNQNGLKASEGIHGVEWFPVSNVQKPSIEEGVKILPEVYNINTSSYRSGHATLPQNLGRDLGQSKKTLQRAPRDLLVTSNKTHNNQKIIDPSGIVSGNEGIKLI